MTSEPQEGREPTPEADGAEAKRRFDEVASLFGGIVPAAGTPVRPARPFRPIPTALPDPASPPILKLTPREPVRTERTPTEPTPTEPTSGEPTRDEPVPGEPPPDASTPSEPVTAGPSTPPPAEATTPEPVPMAAPTGAPGRPSVSTMPRPVVVAGPGRADPVVTRPPPKEIPWPDAFEPRPNYRLRQPKRLSWLLLFPAGIVAAVAITMVDTRALRNWVESSVIHRSPMDTDSGPLPLPPGFRPGGAGAPPASARPPEPQAPQPEPYPAIPTSPVPVPPGTEVSPPPEAPAPTSADASPPPTNHVTIQYRRSAPGADGEARRIAALLHDFGGSVELRPSPATQRTPTITYYNAADKGAANELAATLANEAAGWTVRLGTGKNPAGTLDVSLP